MKAKIWFYELIMPPMQSVQRGPIIHKEIIEGKDMKEIVQKAFDLENNSEILAKCRTSEKIVEATKEGLSLAQYRN